MIKWIHENKRSITVFLVASVVVLSMSFFGVDVPGSRAQRYAIKIGDEKITFDEFQKEKKERQDMMLQQYKKILGNNFSKFADQIYNMPNQDIADDIIAKRLTLQEATRLDLHVGEQQLETFIKQQVFGGNFNASTYGAYLSQTGQSARGFEERIRKELLVENYRSLLTDAAQPSKEEVQNFIKSKETLYDVNYLEFDPKNFEDKVKIDDAELEKYYTANQTDYEIPAKIQYSYIDLSPQNSMQLVEIGSDDIEAYFSENESRYMTPEQVKVQQIQINIPKDADTAKKEEIKKKAEEAHSKASAGEKFEILVPQYSEDFLTVSKNGDLGWINKGKREKSFDEAVFPLKGPGVTSLIATDDAYFIVKVNEYKDSSLKNLAEVKSEIEAELKKREAPAFISAKAYEIFDAWEKGSKSLKDVATENKFNLQSTGKLLGEENDPDPRLKNLSGTVIAANNVPKQIVDIGESSILVEVEKYEESRIPTFAEAKADVLKNYKKEHSVALAREAAQAFVEKVAAQEKLDIKAAAKTDNLKVEEKKGISKAKPDAGIFASKELSNVIFSTTEANAKPSASVSVQGKYYVLAVSSITPPDDKLISEKFKTYETQAAADSANALIQANLNRLKNIAVIDIDNTLLANDPRV